MSSQREPDPRPARVGAESIARTTFPTARRGYDPDRVRTFLAQIADELRDARDREATIRAELEDTKKRVFDTSSLDEAQLTVVLGEETARVLTAAREAAAEIKAKGSDNAARLLKEAQDEASALRQEAETVLARRTDEAEAEATRLRAAAQADVDDLRAEGERIIDAARVEADGIRADAQRGAEREIEAAKQRGREMIDEALAVRSRVLDDLARKRKHSRSQLERLQAGRERLLESYAIVRRTLDEATEELRNSLTAAKIAADSAARRVDLEPMPTAEDLEREVEAAREAGLLVVPPVPELEGEGPVEPAAAGERVADLIAAPDGEATPAEAAPVEDFATELPHEDLVPLEAAADFEEVRLVTDVEVVAEAGDAVEAGEGAAEAPGAGESEGGEAVDVDDLFARLRAAREADVEHAQRVLAEGGADTSEQANAAPESAEPVPAAPADAAAAEPDAVAPADAADEAETRDAAEVSAEAGEPEAARAPDDQALLERRDAITDDAEKKAIRRLKRVLADEQNEVLDRLRRNAKAKVDDLFPALGEHVERYAAAARAQLAEVARAGAAFYGDEPAKTDVGDLALELGQSLVLPLRDRLDTSLREAAGDDEAIADGVRAVYRDWKSHRIESQARDAVIAAFNRGLFDALDPETPLRWLVDNGGSPCPDAEDNSLAGLVVRGEPFPTGHCYPPAHPGCRCLLVPARH